MVQKVMAYTVGDLVFTNREEAETHEVVTKLAELFDGAENITIQMIADKKDQVRVILEKAREDLFDAGAGIREREHEEGSPPAETYIDEALVRQSQVTIETPMYPPQKGDADFISNIREIFSGGKKKEGLRASVA